MIALWIVESVGTKYVFIIWGMDHTSSKSLREREKGYSNVFLSMEGRLGKYLLYLNHVEHIHASGFCPQWSEVVEPDHHYLQSDHH